MSRKIIGLMGFKGCGKDSTANILKEYGYDTLSFAETLKESLCVIFGWDIEMLNGHTHESRIWRDEVDVWWSERLGITDFTPRKAMTMIGTDLFRKHFNEMIWIYALSNKIEKSTSNIVVTDIRFKNEYDMIASYSNSSIFRVRRDTPHWEEDGIKASQGDQEAVTKMGELGIHVSEWEWLSCEVQDVISNTGTFTELAMEVERILKEA